MAHKPPEKNKGLRERTDMARPLTPAYVALSEMLKIDTWVNIPPVIANAFRNTCEYTEKMQEQMQTLNDKILILHRDAEMGDFKTKNMIAQACQEVTNKQINANKLKNDSDLRWQRELST